MKIKSIKNICGYPVATLNGGELNCNRQYDRVYFLGGGGFHYALDNFTSRQEKDPDNIKKLKQFYMDHMLNFAKP